MYTVKTIVEKTIGTNLTKEEVLKLIKDSENTGSKMYVINESNGIICGYINSDGIKD